MRGNRPSPLWDPGSLLSRREMYEQSISPRGIIRCLRRGNGHLRRICTYDNLHLANGLDFTMKIGFPKVAAYTENVDFCYYSICKWRTSEGNDFAIHCFAEDKDLEGRVWSRLEQTTALIRNCKLLIAPDFSLFIDPWLDAFNRNQVRKSRFVAAFWQSLGLPVVPLVSWGNVDSFEYCLEGLPTNSVLALSAQSCGKCKGAKSLWDYAITTITEKLRPTRFLIYGSPDLEIPVDVPVTIIEDFIHKRLRNL